MISTAIALTSACASRGSGPHSAQTTNVTTAIDDDHRHEPRRHDVGQPLNRRARSLRLADHAHDLREQRVGADALGVASRTVPVPFTVPPVTGRPAAFSTGIGSPVIIDSSTLRRAIEDDAVDRHPLAGAHSQAIADRDMRRAARRRSVPSGSMRRAVFGASPSRLRIAAPVRLRARSSSTWPSSTSTTMTAAGSKYTATAPSMPEGVRERGPAQASRPR